jgi:hydrogenase-4 component B
MIYLLVISVLFFIIAIARSAEKHKGTVALVAVLVNGFFSSWIAIGALTGSPYSKILSGGHVFGDIALRVDGLSAWFILLTNFTFVTGILYGRQYMKRYAGQGANLSLHYISYILNQLAIIGIYFIQNGLAFICVWEVMALSAFLLVIFEHGRMETLKAGINYLIQSHISIIFLTLGFIWVYSSTGSFDFSAISQYGFSGSKEAALLLFLAFFIGFAIKAGFVPFHTWLPRAHPAAPSHVSGVMSGVIIKTGIYGILRMLMLIHENYLILGYIILIFSVITGIYGVMLAIVQHNLKKLLAYHSIENIGIIGIGIGIGALGTGLDYPLMAFAGYAGALMHTLNHSLFKSMLFYNAGNIYQSTHTLNIERLGGLIRKMPHTALMFLLASLAICGLPPFNGFISEFLIYSGLYGGLGTNSNSTIIIILSISGLALIGGLALFCFTKAYGIVFLGTPRHLHTHPIEEAGPQALLPNYMIAILIMFIGVMPQLFIRVLQSPVQEFTGLTIPGNYAHLTELMQQISISAWVLILLVVVLFFIRKAVTSPKIITKGSTWGCGYTVASPSMQYTASSFVRSYAKIIKPLVLTNKNKDEIRDIIPSPMEAETHFHDKLEAGLIDWPVKNLKRFLGRFRFLQNGSVQFYVLYGVVFIAISITIPGIIKFIQYLTLLIKQL